MMLLAGAVSGYSQGLVEFYMDDDVGGIPDPPYPVFQQAIYNVSVGTDHVTYGGYTVTEQQGSSAIDTPAGTTVYSGALLGGSASTGKAYDAQMLSAPGAGDALSTLVPVGTPLNFFTSAANTGFVKGDYAETLGAYGSTITLAVAVWANDGVDGPAPTLADAQADGYDWGISNTADDTLSTSGPSLPTGMPSTIESFSLGASEVPDELSTGIVLGVVSASAFLLLSLGRKTIAN